MPVIAIPVRKEGHGNEALWSNIKMPPGIPLATMPENGAYNGALLAIRILALQDTVLASKYSDFVKKQRDDVLAKDAKLQTKD